MCLLLIVIVDLPAEHVGRPSGESLDFFASGRISAGRASPTPAWIVYDDRQRQRRARLSPSRRSTGITVSQILRGGCGRAGDMGHRVRRQFHLHEPCLTSAWPIG